MIKFLEYAGHDQGSYYKFKFTKHDSDSVNSGDFNFGDMVWSDGEYIIISDFVDNEQIDELFCLVENKSVFFLALDTIINF